MSVYFFRISGEDVELAKVEVEALVHMLSPSARIDWYDRLAIVDSDLDLVQPVISRAALVKEAGEVISSQPVSCRDGPNYGRYIGPGDTFCVRSQHRSFHYRKEIERVVGEQIRQQTGAVVSLKSPTVKLAVFDIADMRVICKTSRSRVWEELKSRSSRRKPFFHPSMMNSTLARVMCNLAQVKPGDVVLDPFCGGGGILCEAALLGAKSIGLDLSRELIKGAASNLRGLGTVDASLILGDARNLPLSRVDCIVSDPPYGHASSTRGAKSTDLVEMTISQIEDLLPHEGRMCLCGSTEMNIRNILSGKKFTIRHCINVRVHRSLTREIIVAIRQ